MAELTLVDAFMVLFIGMGPIKALLIYIGATQGASPEVQRQVARKAATTAAAVALILLLAGAFFMRLLHFSTGALTIAGGLILLALAMGILLSPAAKEDHDSAPDDEALLGMASYPLGIPLILNPIGIVALTVFSAETQQPLQWVALAGLVLLIAVLDYAVLSVAHRLDHLLTHERIVVLEKLLAILLAALAVQLVINGLAMLGIITVSAH